jgi:hypothetical protein
MVPLCPALAGLMNCSIAIAKRSSDMRFSIYCRSTSLRLVSSRSGIISLYDAGMFSIYLVCLVWGAIKIVGGEVTWGWIWVVTAAGLFGSRMYFVLNERK